MRLERGEVRLAKINGAIDLDLERTNVEIDLWQIFLEPGDRLVFFPVE
ncbi:MAG: hypothetical protein QF879_06890 [Candidatus Latescibacteria bacterium]|jgi:hypothetical protein|nr:hypothetical protein [Candidatus Latescibacterota bacterium]MDP7236249.1 hypothetical protein [Candidatus Latescibacterota bacterium]